MRPATSVHDPSPELDLSPDPDADGRPDPDESYDVVVVGARCAGAATAMLLAGAGLKVLAVERSRRGADTLSTHALTRPGVLQLSRWGVLDEIRRAGTPRVSRVAFHYGEHAVEVPIRPDGDVDGLYAPRRTVLDRVLVDAAVRAGAHVLHRTRVVDLVVDPAARVGGVVVERHGRRTTVRSRLVIGADGARSFVARAVGAPDEHRAATSSALAYAYVPGLPTDAYTNHFEPGMIAGVIPTNGGEANVWAGVAMDRFGPDARRDVQGFFRRVLAATVPDLDAHVARHGDLRLRTFPGMPGFTRRAWGPGWALVGDAVYFKDPVSAHGITDALIGAELLARAVVDVFRGGSEQACLAAYARARAELAEPMRGAVEHLASFAWSPLEVQDDHLAMNEAMRAEWQALRSLTPLRRVDEGVAS